MTDKNHVSAASAVIAVRSPFELMALPKDIPTMAKWLQKKLKTVILPKKILITCRIKLKYGKLLNLANAKKDYVSFHKLFEQIFDSYSAHLNVLQW